MSARVNTAFDGRLSREIFWDQDQAVACSSGQGAELVDMLSWAMYYQAI